MAGTDPTTDAEMAEPTADRRSLFTRGAAAAATVAGLAVGRSAQAANGDNMKVGSPNTATTSTTISGGSTFRVVNGTTGGVNGYEASILGEQNSEVAAGVLGLATAFEGVGVYGTSEGSSGIGVLGAHTSAVLEGTGVVGTSSLGAGVYGIGTSADVVAGGSGRVLLRGAGANGTPTARAETGTIARDPNGNLWYAYATDRWRKIAGSGTGGAFHPITPVRVYDSRLRDGKLAASRSRVVRVRNAIRPDGSLATPNVVPAGATAVVGNLTIAGTEGGAGALAVAPGNVSSTSTSTINWRGRGVLLANGFTVKLDTNRQVKVFALGNASHFIIDITGYYL